MFLYIEDAAYPELTHYLRNPKRRAKFLYRLECKLDGNKVKGSVKAEPKTVPVMAPIQPIIQSEANLDYEKILAMMKEAQGKGDDAAIKALLAELGDVLKGVDSRLNKIESRPFVSRVPGAMDPGTPANKEEDDLSDTTGIDFSKAIAVFDD